jgi:6-phosphogluconolactonase
MNGREASRLHAARVLNLAMALMVPASCAGLRTRPSPPAAPTHPAQPHTFVYVATVAGEIEVVELDTKVGHLTGRGKAALGETVLSLAGLPLGQLLLATTDRNGSVVSLAVDPRTGTLTSLSRAEVGGTLPMGAAVDGTGRYVAVANHGSGNVSIVPIRPDGHLADADSFAAGRGPSAVGFHPSNNAAFVVNERDGTISQYSFNAGTGALTAKPGRPLGVPGDAHPRQIRCHPSGRFVYVRNESSETISVHAFDERMGALTHLAFQVVSATPAGAPPGKKRGGSMSLGPSGQFLYVSSRGHDTIAVFEVDTETGELLLRAHVPSGGQDPIELGIDPTGAFLIVANQQSRNLSVFRIADRGELAMASTFSLGGVPVALHTLRPPFEAAPTWTLSAGP